MRFAVPFSMARTVSAQSGAAILARRAMSSSEVSSGWMTVFRISMISPSSIPADRYMAVTPASSQWFRIERCTGAEPRSSGRILPCMLIAPWVGISSTACGRILP